MFVKQSIEGFRELLPGVHMKPLGYGEATLMCEFRLAAGSEIPSHDHPHEQTGYLVSGRMRLNVAGEVWEVEPGDSWCVPGGTPHAAAILADTVVIEVFSPARREYLP